MPITALVVSAIMTFSFVNASSNLSSKILTSYGQTNLSNNGSGDYKIKVASQGRSILNDNSYTKNEADLKLENINDKFESKFELLSGKIDNGFKNQSIQLDNQLQSFKVQQMETKKEMVRWYRYCRSISSLLSH